jgi:ubiquinone/menaquinone biosynthesis C-methylase UbiE
MSLPASEVADVVRSPALARFLAAIASRQTPELLDLGPGIGPNVAFFGERISCKIRVEDLYADLDHHARRGTLDQFTEFLATRLPLPDQSIDAVLCWDLFDYLEAPAARVLAGELIRLLKPEGALLVFFSTVASDDRCYTRYVIEDEEHLRYRTYPAACSRQRILENRDILKLFERLRVTDSILLKSQLREMVFRKPATADPLDEAAVGAGRPLGLTSRAWRGTPDRPGSPAASRPDPAR